MKRIPILVLLLAAACSRAPRVAPGYDGPILSPAGMAAVRDLVGRDLGDAPPSFGAGPWKVEGFAVVPCPWGKGPVCRLSSGPAVRVLPMEGDGDAADLHRRVEGRPHGTLAGTVSARYQDAVEGRINTLE